MDSANSPLTVQEPDIEREHLFAPKATFHTLPNELLLHIFSYLSLGSLIIARGVSQRWRPLVDIASSPTRRSLLQHYLEVIKSPSFLNTREHLLPELQAFDRESYVSSVETETGVRLPEEFRVWVLEWPDKAVSTWLWPGLESISSLPFQSVLPRRTMNLLKLFGVRPRKIHFRHRSTSDDTIVLRPMSHNTANDRAHDWCWMLLIQVARDPLAMDFLLFGGVGLGAGVKDTVLMVRDDVVRPGMGWVEYLQKELQKQDECYLTETAGAPISPPSVDAFAGAPPQVTFPPPRSRYRLELGKSLRRLRVLMKTAYRTSRSMGRTAADT